MWLLNLVFLAVACADVVTVLSAVQTLYNRSPQLRIKGTGFGADEHHIFLDLSANGQPSLKLDKDYLISKYDEGLILKLMTKLVFSFLFIFVCIFTSFIIIDGFFLKGKSFL